ncbi:MAG: hypothetical protein JWQ48_532 [Conexibacter sp.]|nr:hypothetical protein [Conexibacter sp.]
MAAHLRAARADALYDYLCAHGGDDVEAIRADLPDWTRGAVERAVDDLVADGRAFLEARDGAVHVGPLTEAAAR